MKIQDWIQHKKNAQKITVVTCYDYSFAKIIAETNIHSVLVGDSLAMTIHGHPSTLTATMQMMELHTLAVAKGIGKKFVIADMPFMSFRGSLDRVVENAAALMRAGASAIKIEGAAGNLETIEYLVQSGIPVMGHLGLTPQFIHALGGYKVQGKGESATIVQDDARKLQEAGCFAVVLECVPADLGENVSAQLEIPVIGIGAGPNTDGQVLVLQDLLGLNLDFKPTFVRKFMEGGDSVRAALNQFHSAVMEGSFPSDKESFFK